MSTETEIFEAIRRYLWQCTVDFCLIFSLKKGEGPPLKWRSATSLRFEKRDDCETFAAKYHALATRYYKLKRDRIFEEVINPLGSWSTYGLVKGRLLRALRVLAPTPANAIGQRWWLLVIASGPTRDAGYVIVTRVAAKDEKEVRKYITDIQAIMSNEATPAGGG